VERFTRFVKGLFVNSPAPQLEMLWPVARLGNPPAVRVPDGYALRNFRLEDGDAYITLLHRVGFTDWSQENLNYWLDKVLPDGFFVITKADGGPPVATAMGSHNPSERHPFAGELGWVATSPEHLGKGLATAVCAAVTARFLRAQYRRVYLKTDDHRLPAIKVYLRLGYVPFLFEPQMEDRWKAICEQLHVPFTPAEWRKETPGSDA
jgi:mycothiol synthase